MRGRSRLLLASHLFHLPPRAGLGSVGSIISSVRASGGSVTGAAGGAGVELPQLWQLLSVHDSGVLQVPARLPSCLLAQMRAYLSVTQPPLRPHTCHPGVDPDARPPAAHTPHRRAHLPLPGSGGVRAAGRAGHRPQRRQAAGAAWGAHAPTQRARAACGMLRGGAPAPPPPPTHTSRVPPAQVRSLPHPRSPQGLSWQYVAGQVGEVRNRSLPVAEIAASK